MSWKKTISLKALQGAGSVPVKLGDRVMFMVRSDSGVYAIDAVCSHAMDKVGSKARCILSSFDPEKMTVRCTCHNAVFDLSSGRMIEPPSVAEDAPMGELGLSIYRTRETEGFIEVDMPD